MSRRTTRAATSTTLPASTASTAGLAERRGARPAAREPARRTVGRLVGRRARLRWVHLVLGGALLMPFQLAALSAISTTGIVGEAPGALIAAQFLALACALPFVAMVGLVPLVRTLEGNAVRVLGAPRGEVLTAPATSGAARRRASVWFTLHALLGGVVGGISLAMPPAGVLFVILSLFPDRADTVGRLGTAESGPVAGVFLGVALVFLPIPVSAAFGAWLARLAPVLLGPTPADRLALAEQRAERLAERARIARDLHDSVGHALSAVGIQASAAGRLLDRDPAFAARALAAIEETARDAVAELDHVLGLLREESRPTTAPASSPANLSDLVARTRAAGADITLDLDLGLDLGICLDLGPGDSKDVTDARDARDARDGLPRVVSREAYRIVQEGLGNVLRHAGAVPIRLRVAVADGELTIVITNPIPVRGAAARRAGGGGGRGLRGIAERTSVLGGSFSAGPQDGWWHLTARIPLEGPT
ncbi:histidine kinase [Streptomyces sp. SID3343]|nr:histidine kinase [Streptomyces sp. SID3343]